VALGDRPYPNQVGVVAFFPVLVAWLTDNSFFLFCLPPVAFTGHADQSDTSSLAAGPPTAILMRQNEDLIQRIGALEANQRVLETRLQEEGEGGVPPPAYGLPPGLGSRPVEREKYRGA
jgi:hypothetical protein